MTKRRPKTEELGFSPFEARWKRRSPENSRVEVIQNVEEIYEPEPFVPTRPKRLAKGKRPPFYRTLSFKDLAVLHVALTSLYQRSAVDAIAAEYDDLLLRVEQIMRERPRNIRFQDV
jgi:hypothetical protein